MRIHYERHGDGPTVLLLHGIPGCGQSWNGVAERLRRDHDVIVPDLIGFGRSERKRSLPELHANAQAQALARLLDSLDVHDVTVAGHDFGGPVAILLASQRLDLIRRIALFSTNAFPDTPIPFPLSTVRLPGVGRLAGQVLFSKLSLQMMLRTGVGASDVRLNVGTYLGDRAQRTAIRQIFEGSLRQLRDLYAPIESALAQLAIPVVVGWGDRDPFFSVEVGRRTAEATNARFELYAGAGHFLPEERPDHVAAAVHELTAAIR